MFIEKSTSLPHLTGLVGFEHIKTKKTGESMKLILALALVLGLSACVTGANQPGDRTNLTFGAVKSKIKKGQTTQVEVVQLLGSPNITSKNKAGQEVWTYSRTGTTNEKASASGGLLGGAGALIGGIGGSKAVDTTSVSTFDLIITFTNNDIVDDYSVVTSKF